MEFDFAELYHYSSKNLSSGHAPVSPDVNDQPLEWRTTYYKTYPRLQKIDLPLTPLQADLFETLSRRRSRRDFIGVAITQEELSSLLRYSCGITAKSQDDRYRRTHPSEGGNFPIEIYPIIFRKIDDILPGVYHYNIRNHQLDVLWKRDFSPEDVDSLFIYKWAKDAACVLIMTAVFERTRSKYGERGYRYIFHEAGHIGQNVYLVSEALELKCCALGGTREENIEKVLDVDGVNESVVYALAVGR